MVLTCLGEFVYIRPSVPISIQVLRKCDRTLFNGNDRATVRFSRHAQVGVQPVLKYDDKRQRLPSADERLDIRIDLGKTQK
ncbi:MULTISPECIES: hypothetical protein [Nostocaceae]|uniref:hypothetical protein n=1 Tax=Nostocaceae TaxID=1162 RepID=UPI001F5524A6|nr:MULTISPECIES: hypothetical protein [Nostocaceae]